MQNITNCNIGIDWCMLVKEGRKSKIGYKNGEEVVERVEGEMGVY